jgi:hypothetical protein
VAILDTFYILFKSDSKDAEKGIKNVNKSVKNLNSSLLATATKAISLAAIFKSLTSAFSYASEISAASQALQVNANDLEVWGNALKTTGGNVGSLTSSLQSLADHLQTTPRVALQVLPKLAEQFEKLNQFQATRYGKIIGLDMPAILLLQKGRRELDSIITRQKELSTVTEKDAEALNKFKYQINNTGLAFKKLSYMLVRPLLPTIEKIMTAFQNMSLSLGKHSGFIKGALVTVAVIAGVLAAKFMIVNAAITVVRVVLTALAAAIGLVWDDIQVFMEGGDSLIGRAIERWPVLSKVVKATMQAIKLAFKGVLWFFDGMAIGIKKLIKGFKTVGNAISKFTGKFKDSKVNVMFDTAQRELNLATNSGLASQTSSSIFNNSVNNKNLESSINISDITINTQATDASQIVYGLTTELKKQFRQTQNEVANGVLI